MAKIKKQKDEIDEVTIYYRMQRAKLILIGELSIIFAIMLMFV